MKHNSKVGTATNKRTGGDQCYLLQICSDRTKVAATEQGDDKPGNWELPFGLPINVGNLPGNRKPKVTIKPGSPEWTDSPTEAESPEPEAEETPSVEEEDAPMGQDVPEGVAALPESAGTPESLSHTGVPASGLNYGPVDMQGQQVLFVPPNEAKALAIAARARANKAEGLRAPRPAWHASTEGTHYRPTAAGGVVVPGHKAPLSTGNKARAANRVGAKVNLALTLADLGTELYAGWRDGKIETVEDVIDYVAKYPDQVVQGLRETGEAAIDAVVKSDPVALAEVGLQLTPMPTTARITRNVLGPSRPVGYLNGRLEGDLGGIDRIESSVDRTPTHTDMILGEDLSVADTISAMSGGFGNLVNTAAGLLPWRW